MNSKQGIAALQKLYGKKAMYRVDPAALVGAEREAALAAIPALREESARLDEAMKARREAILAADAEYQALKLAAVNARSAYDKARVVPHARRVTVGKNMGFAFSVTGCGDNWQQAIDAAKSKASA